MLQSCCCCRSRLCHWCSLQEETSDQGARRPQVSSRHFREPESEQRKRQHLSLSRESEGEANGGNSESKKKMKNRISRHFFSVRFMLTLSPFVLAKKRGVFAPLRRPNSHFLCLTTVLLLTRNQGAYLHASKYVTKGRRRERDGKREHDLDLARSAGRPVDIGRDCPLSFLSFGASIPSRLTHSFSLTHSPPILTSTITERRRQIFTDMFVRKLGGRAAMAAAARSEVSFFVFDETWRKREKEIHVDAKELTRLRFSISFSLRRHELDFANRHLLLAGVRESFELNEELASRENASTPRARGDFQRGERKMQ